MDRIYQTCTRTVEELFIGVETAFNQLGFEKLENIFLVQEVMLCGEGNGYKIVHMDKEKLRRNCLLPTSMQCTSEAIY
jgi:hypothetical protein